MMESIWHDLTEGEEIDYTISNKVEFLQGLSSRITNWRLRPWIYGPHFHSVGVIPVACILRSLARHSERDLGNCTGNLPVATQYEIEQVEMILPNNPELTQKLLEPVGSRHFALFTSHSWEDTRIRAVDEGATLAQTAYLSLLKSTGDMEQEGFDLDLLEQGAVALIEFTAEGGLIIYAFPRDCMQAVAKAYNLA